MNFRVFKTGNGYGIEYWDEKDIDTDVKRCKEISEMIALFTNEVVKWDKTIKS